MSNNFGPKLSRALKDGPRGPQKSRFRFNPHGVAIVRSPKQALEFLRNSQPGAKRVPTSQNALRMVMLTKELKNTVRSKRNNNNLQNNYNLLINLQRTSPLGSKAKKINIPKPKSRARSPIRALLARIRRQ